MGLGTSSALDTIIHPDLHRSLARAYPSYVTVQEATETQGDDNSIVETWADVPQLRGMHGILAVASERELRRANLTNVSATHVLGLQSYHPEIAVTHRVIVSRDQGESGTTFNITGIRHDSQARSTFMALEKVSH